MTTGHRSWMWLPLVVAVSGLTTTGWVFHILKVLDEAHVQERVEVQASRKGAELRDRLKSLTLMLVRMGRRWETRGTPPRYEWEVDAQQYVEPDSILRAIEWASSRDVVRWVVPEAGNEEDIDFPLRSHPVLRDAVGLAEDRQTSIMSRSFRRTGEYVFALCVPLRINGESDGTIIGILRVHNVLAEALGREIDPDFTYQVEEAGILLGTSKNPVRKYGRSEIIAVNGLEWRLTVYPTAEFLAGARSDVPRIVLVLGIFSSLLLAMAVGFARTARARTHLVEEANRALLREMLDRRRADEEIRRLNAELEHRVEERTAELSRSNEELQRFAYVASHDLQEPLRTISSFTQLLARRYRGKLDDDAEEFIKFAVDGCTRMQALINALLTYSRLDTRALPFTRVRLEDTLKAALLNLRTACEETGARIVHEPLPEIQGDESQLSQLFQNLIGNAIKFRGDRTPDVIVSAEERGGEWVLSIADNGIGIDPKHAARIFIIFQRLNRREEYPGTGIGLAICKKIIERHGGRIWVESDPGRGSVFKFTLPVIAVPDMLEPEDALSGA